MSFRTGLPSAATAIAMSLAFALPAVAAPAAASHSAGVKFTSQSGVATLVTHYEVSPTGPAERALAATQRSRSSAAPQESRSVILSPKHLRDAKSAKATKLNVAGVAGANTGSAGHGSNGDGTPSPSASFIGQAGSAITCSYFAHGCNPPDMALAASPSRVLQGVNTQWEVLDRSGNVQPGWPVSAQTLFGVPNVTAADGTPCDVGSGSQPFLSDPRALYDPIDQRFWAAMLQLENGLGIATDCPLKAVYYVAVSQTSDPSGGWNVYEFDMTMGQPFVADFTQLGLNGQAVYFSANMFTQDGSAFPYAELFEANKAKMEKGQGGFTADGFFNMQATGPGAPATAPFLADTVQPALNLDGSAGKAEIFVDTLDGPDPMTGHFCGFFGGGSADSCKGLALWSLTNPVGHDSGGKAPVLKGTYVPNVNAYVFSPPADEPGCTQCVDPSDLRISGTPVVRDGSVYAAWETGIDNGTQTVPGIEWAKINLDNPGGKKSATSGYYNFSGDTAVSYPALMPEANGNLLMLFERMSSTVNPETRYIVRGSNQDQFTGDGVLLKAGESPYRPTVCGITLPVCRWGDFSAASFDGAGRIWFAGEYATQASDPAQPPVFGRNWGTWIGAINVREEH